MFSDIRRQATTCFRKRPVSVNSTAPIQVEYAIDLEPLRALVELSAFCVQEAAYECVVSMRSTGQGVMRRSGFLK